MTEPAEPTEHRSPVGPPRWRVRLLGEVSASGAGQQVLRFPARAVATLLARLALAPERAHAREELIELLWPGVAPDIGRNRLRQVLSTLKSLHEPAGDPGHAVLLADRLSVRVVPDALACDALDFQRLAAAANAAHTAQARALYQGELMPGYYDDWVESERRRLVDLYQGLARGPQTGPGPVEAAAPARGPAAAP